MISKRSQTRLQNHVQPRDFFIEYAMKCGLFLERFTENLQFTQALQWKSNIMTILLL